jgi:DNA-binding beta-propeller fold protein YncE
MVLINYAEQPDVIPGGSRCRNVLRRAFFFTVICGMIAAGTGCASKWSPAAEYPAQPPQWLDQSNAAGVRHLFTVRGFKETGTSIANKIKYLFLGKKDEDSIVRPVAAATGSDNRIAIADVGCGCVHLYIPSAQGYRQIFSAGKEDLRSPVSVVFDDELNLYVSDSLNSTIYVFDAKGESLYSIKKAGYGTLLRPTGLAYSAQKKILYAVDTLANKIYAFTNKGNLLFSFGERGDKKGQFNFPTHIVASPDGRLYVTDSMNFRVQVFDASGAFLSSFGHHGNGSGDFAMPKGIAVDKAGVIYVVDSLFDNIQLFNLSGSFLLTIGGRGTGHGEFWLPSGLFLDNQNKLYVCDTYNQRVQVFQIIGNRHE